MKKLLKSYFYVYQYKGIFTNKKINHPSLHERNGNKLRIYGCLSFHPYVKDTSTNRMWRHLNMMEKVAEGSPERKLDLDMEGAL